MLYAFGRKSSLFYDTVRVQDAVFESGQKGLTVVGHRSGLGRTAIQAEILPAREFPQGTGNPARALRAMQRTSQYSRPS